MNVEISSLSSYYHYSTVFSAWTGKGASRVILYHICELDLDLDLDLDLGNYTALSRKALNVYCGGVVLFLNWSIGIAMDEMRRAGMLYPCFGILLVEMKRERDERLRLGLWWVWLYGALLMRKGMGVSIDR